MKSTIDFGILESFFLNKLNSNEFRAYKEKADKFLLSRKGIFMRFGVLGGLVIGKFCIKKTKIKNLFCNTAYPIANIVLKGPLLSIIFSRRYNITEEWVILFFINPFKICQI
jgi:hypothetical protein